MRGLDMEGFRLKGSMFGPAFGGPVDAKSLKLKGRLVVASNPSQAYSSGGWAEELCGSEVLKKSSD